MQKTDRASFSHKHLIGISNLTPDDITTILDLADYYADRLENRSYQSDILKGAVVMTLFFEDSTRTRMSFEVAAKRLGAEVAHFEPRLSSESKGESFLDTILTLNAMGPDAMIVRHKEHGAPAFVASKVDCPVINAGDSWNEHPTQALLDALTIRRRFGKIDGLKIAICGDVAHSRVASSNMELLTKMGALVNVVAPPALLPKKVKDGVQVFDSMEEGLKDCDIVMMLRNQYERMEAGLIKSEAEFFEQYGLTYEKLAFAKKDALIMHPGPMNRGVEIAEDVADDPKRSLIREQVHNGVPTRMAVLDLLLKGKF